jgi:hypothetical protein
MDETEVHAAQLSALLAVATANTTDAVDSNYNNNNNAHDDDQKCVLSDTLYQSLSELLEQVGCSEALDRSCSAVLSAAYPTVADARRALLLLEQHLSTVTSTATAACNEVSAALSRLATYGLLTDTAALGCSGMQQWQWFRGCDLPTVMQQWLQVRSNNLLCSALFHYESKRVDCGVYS